LVLQLLSLQLNARQRLLIPSHNEELLFKTAGEMFVFLYSIGQNIQYVNFACKVFPDLVFPFRNSLNAAVSLSHHRSISGKIVISFLFFLTFP
jgi:hypothetical protein